MLAGGLLVAGLLAVGSQRAQAQAAAVDATGRSFSIVPTLSISSTLTDNSQLTTNDRQADLITLVSPAVRMSSNGGRIRGFLDYALTGIIHARDSSSNELQNRLSAAVSAEAIENWAFVDATASISQQAISAFGTQSSDSTLANDNRTETRSFTVSPYVRGRLTDFADYEGRLSYATTRSGSSAASDSTNSGASVRVGSNRSWGRLGWSVSASRNVFDFSEGRRTEDDRLRGVLSFTVNPQWRLSVIGGRESNNFVSIDKESHGTHGLGIDWAPSERTRLSAQGERRFFGNSHNFVFEHRTPRTVWRASDSRDASTGFGQARLTSQGTIYDLLFAQLASQQPDPVLRAQLVNNFLLANGIPPNATVVTGALTSAITLERRQELSFAWLGLRDTLVFAGSQSDARRLDTVASVNDDFANQNRIRQRVLTASWAHRLTPESTLNLLVAAARTTGSASASPSTTLRTIALSWNTRTGPRSNLSVGARHTVFDSPSQPYSESAATATLNFQF